MIGFFAFPPLTTYLSVLDWRMAKKQKQIKAKTAEAKPESTVEPAKPLTKEEVSKFKPADQLANLSQVMGFDLTTAYNVGLNLSSDNPAVVAGEHNPKTKMANVDRLPQPNK